MTTCNSCILAVDAGGTSLKAALVSENPQVGDNAGLAVRTFFSVPVNSDGTKEEILASYEAVGREGAAQAAKENVTISRVNVCIPGPFDFKNGMSLMKHKYQAVYEIPLGPQLTKGIGTDCPVTFLHDSTAFLLGAIQSAPEKKDNICGVMIGTGLGFACMIDGKIQQNPSGGPAVSIYARPYLDSTSEEYVSKRGIMNRYQAKLRAAGVQTAAEADAQPTVADIAAMARKGDAIAMETFADTGYHLGQILLPILKEYHFDTVLLGGAISKSADLYMPRLCEVLSEVGATACPTADIDQAPIIGAAQYRAQ